MAPPLTLLALCLALVSPLITTAHPAPSPWSITDLMPSGSSSDEIEDSWPKRFPFSTGILSEPTDSTLNYIRGGRSGSERQGWEAVAMLNTEIRKLSDFNDDVHIWGMPNDHEDVGDIGFECQNPGVEGGASIRKDFLVHVCETLQQEIKELGFRELAFEVYQGKGNKVATCAMGFGDFHQGIFAPPTVEEVT